MKVSNKKAIELQKKYRNFVAEQFEVFMSYIDPDKECSALQKSEMRKAWFAGAFNMFKEVIDLSAEPEDVGVIALDIIDAEFTEYYRQIKAEANAKAKFDNRR